MVVGGELCVTMPGTLRVARLPVESRTTHLSWLKSETGNLSVLSVAILALEFCCISNY